MLPCAWKMWLALQARKSLTTTLINWNNCINFHTTLVGCEGCRKKVVTHFWFLKISKLANILHTDENFLLQTDPSFFHFIVLDNPKHKVMLTFYFGKNEFPNSFDLFYNLKSNQSFKQILMPHLKKWMGLDRFEKKGGGINVKA